MNFGTIFMFTITISTFICTTALENNENDYLCYCLVQDKKDTFCTLDRDSTVAIEVSLNRRIRASLATGLVLTNYLKATNMLYSRWDENLARKAQKYANDCPRSQDMDIKQAENGFYHVQNFAIKEFHVQSKEFKRFLGLRRYRFERVFDEWKMEPKRGSVEKELDGKSNRTNMIRSSTWKIGCGVGVSAKESEEKYREHYVCYFETGEVNAGKPLYKHGCESCKDCPDKTECDFTTFGLCHSSYSSEYIRSLINAGHLCTPHLKSENTEDHEKETDKLSAVPPSQRVPKFSFEVDDFHDIDSCEEVEEHAVDKTLIWQCNSWKSQNCIIKEMCDSNWNIAKVQGIKMLYSPFQNSIATFLFYKKIYLKKESCYSFKFKLIIKGVQTQLAIFAFPVGDINQLQWNAIRPDIDMKKNVYLYLPWKETDIQVGVSVKCLNVEIYQDLIVVEGFKIKEGNCPNTKK